MAKKIKREPVSYSDAGDRFRQISNKRAKRLIKAVRQLRTMLPQPSYDISQEDAQILLDALDKEYTPLAESLQKLAEGESLTQKKTTEIENIF